MELETIIICTTTNPKGEVELVEYGNRYRVACNEHYDSFRRLGEAVDYITKEFPDHLLSMKLENKQDYIKAISAYMARMMTK